MTVTAHSRILRGLWLPAFLMGLGSLSLPEAGAADSSSEEATNRFTARAAAAFQAARQRYFADTNNTEAAWQLGRVAFNFGELATNNAHRAELAEQGIAATRRATLREPSSAEAHYYLAMNLGQLARTKNLGALPLVTEMEKLFKRARELSPKLDQAGPDRNLGQLYRDAPGWPASIGNTAKAREHLMRAVQLAPNYPENRLNLVETYFQWREFAAARRELEALKALWSKARETFTGEDWEPFWADWEMRRAQVQRKLDGPLPKEEILNRNHMP